MFRGKFDDKIAQKLVGATQELVIVPFQAKIAARLLWEIIEIIDREHIIVTGRYRESFVPLDMPTPESMDVTVGSVDCPYAVFLEYGTSKMAPRAVIRRAMAEVHNALNARQLYKFSGGLAPTGSYSA